MTCSPATARVRGSDTTIAFFALGKSDRNISAVASTAPLPTTHAFVSVVNFSASSIMSI